MSHAMDMLSPAQASIRKHLGEFADVLMENKIKLLRKLGDQISATNDSDTLKRLRDELNDSFISQADIDSLDTKLGMFLDMFNSKLDSLMEIQTKIAQIKKSDISSRHGHG